MTLDSLSLLGQVALTQVIGGTAMLVIRSDLTPQVILSLHSVRSNRRWGGAVGVLEWVAISFSNAGK